MCCLWLSTSQSNIHVLALSIALPTLIRSPSPIRNRFIVTWLGLNSYNHKQPQQEKCERFKSMHDLVRMEFGAFKTPKHTPKLLETGNTTGINLWIRMYAYAYVCIICICMQDNCQNVCTMTQGSIWDIATAFCSLRNILEQDIWSIGQLSFSSL